MHLDRRELGQDLGRILEPRPVELQVLARGEVAVASVILASDMRQLAQLSRREHPVGNRDAQHRGVLLDVEPVLQTQRPELVLGQLAGKEAPRLVAELRDPVVDEALIVGIVAVHGGALYTAGYRRRYICKRNVWRLDDSGW